MKQNDPRFVIPFLIGAIVAVIATGRHVLLLAIAILALWYSFEQKRRWFQVVALFGVNLVVMFADTKGLSEGVGILLSAAAAGLSIIAFIDMTSRPVPLDDRI